MNLRNYQAACVDRVFQEWAIGKRSTIAVKPTGTGKTVTFASIIARWLADNPDRSAMVIAHREELIFQAADKIERVTGIKPDIEMADLTADRDARIVVSTVQTQTSGSPCGACSGTGKLGAAMCSLWQEEEGETGRPCPHCVLGRYYRMLRFDPQRFGLLIIDEAHHGTAATYRRLINYYKHAQILGVTATPDRADEEALGQVFDSVAYVYEIQDAINDGWLVPIDQMLVRVDDLDFSACRTTAGDLNQGDLEHVMMPAEGIDRSQAMTPEQQEAVAKEERLLHAIVDPTLQLAGDQPCLIFTSGVAHAERVAEIINRWRDGAAVCIHGKTPTEERRQHLERYKRGEFQCLVNCGVFLEGFDEPRIAVVAIARPTKSRALYAQMAGRGMRPLSGVVDGLEDSDARKEAIACSAKPRMLILDFVGNSGRHKLMTSADILAGNYSDEVVEQAKAAMAKKSALGMAADAMQELLAAQRAIEEEKRAARRKVRATASYRTQAVNPFDVLDVTPTREPGWHKGRKPSEKQTAFLQKAGVPFNDLTTFWEASQLIGEVIRRREQGLATYKQSQLLGKHGYDPNVSFTEARRLIDALAANNWKRPPEAVEV